MKRPTFKECFISAPFGVDTSALRLALEQRSIRWHDQTAVALGGSWLEALDTELERADFVCVVMPSEHATSNAWFELGIAYARRKPILAFIGSSVSVAQDIRSLTYVRTDLADTDTILRALDAFLQHAPASATFSRLPARTKPRLSSQTVPRLPGTATALDFERQTADLLKKAGFIVSEPTERQNQGADFAVWIDELQNSLGNPLLVEVKVGELSPQALTRAADQLRSQVTKTHGRCGLLVYWDRREREFPSPSVEWPPVFMVNGFTLAKLVTKGELTRELIRMRNAAFHGKG